MNARRTTFALLTAGLSAIAAAQNTLSACGSRNLEIVMEQVPTSWWSWQLNNDAMWLWNQYVDIYRYVPGNGTWGDNGDSEFAGWPTDAQLQSTWGSSWGTFIAMTFITRSLPIFLCSCCRINQSDVAFNPAFAWTSDQLVADTNQSVLHYTTNLLHELGHSWGLQTGGAEYHFNVPTVMHLYEPASVHPGLTIHAPDAYLLRRNYASRRAASPLTDIAVFSQYPTIGLRNTRTDRVQYGRGAPITVMGLTVENTGTTAIGNAHVRLYLSSDRTITTSDILLGDWYWNSLPAESWGSYDLVASIPSTTPDGSYYVGAIVTTNGYGGDNLPDNDRTRLFGQISVNCPDDLYEQNDTAAQAASLTPGLRSGLQICRFDDDWYRIQVPQGYRLSASIQFSNAVGDLDLYLYDAGLNLVDWSTSVTDGESVAAPYALATQSYYVRVTGYAGAENTYSLNLDVPSVPATSVAYGAACGRASKAFYERFGRVQDFDLANTSMQLVKTGNHYVARPGAAFVPPTAAAVPLALGDESEIAVSLAGASFPFIGGSTSVLYVCSNGFVSAGPGNPIVRPGNPTSWLSATQPRWGCWHDFEPTAPGSGPILFEQVGAMAYVTWDGVTGGNGGDVATFQLRFDLVTGNVNYAWRNVASIGSGSGNKQWIVGYAAAAPNNDIAVDISAALPATFRTSADNADALSLTASPPRLGATSTLSTTGFPPSAPLGMQLLGLAAVVPALPLDQFGMPGCFLHAGIDVVSSIWSTSGVASYALVIPWDPALLGAHVYAQSLAFVDGVNPAGVVVSNGADLRIGNQ